MGLSDRQRKRFPSSEAERKEGCLLAGFRSTTVVPYSVDSTQGTYSAYVLMDGTIRQLKLELRLVQGEKGAKGGTHKTQLSLTRIFASVLQGGFYSI